MAEKPEALRLAAECDTGHPLEEDAKQAAAELRFLHAVNQELLKALKQALEECIWPNERLSDVYEKARTAIAKAEGEKT